MVSLVFGCKRCSQCDDREQLLLHSPNCYLPGHGVSGGGAAATGGGGGAGTGAAGSEGASTRSGGWGTLSGGPSGTLAARAFAHAAKLPIPKMPTPNTNARNTANTARRAHVRVGRWAVGSWELDISTHWPWARGS